MPSEAAKLALISGKATPEPSATEKHVVPHRSFRRRLSPQAIVELVARYSAGEETPALSQGFGISASGLRDLLRAEDIPLRAHAMTVQDAEEAVQLCKSGLTITQVIFHIGYSNGTIRQVLLKHGIAIRSGSRGKQVVPSE